MTLRDRVLPLQFEGITVDYPGNLIYKVKVAEVVNPDLCYDQT
jgi:hypothetical protein